jgi:hypothetical protein
MTMTYGKDVTSDGMYQANDLERRLAKKCERWKTASRARIGLRDSASRGAVQGSMAYALIQAGCYVGTYLAVMILLSACH